MSDSPDLTEIAPITVTMSTDDLCGLPDGSQVWIAAAAKPRPEFPDAPPRVVFTDRAVALTAQLIDAHGEVLFEQSGGCCEGTAPLCLRKDKFYVGSRELLLGTVDIEGHDVDVWLTAGQFRAWRHTQLVLDATPGRGATFSLDETTGQRFLSLARVWTPDEVALLDAAPPPRKLDVDASR